MHAGFLRHTRELPKAQLSHYLALCVTCGNAADRHALCATFPPHQPGRHGWAELLGLVNTVGRLAFARNLPPAEALGRIWDAYRDYDEGS